MTVEKRVGPQLFVVSCKSQKEECDYVIHVTKSSTFRHKRSTHSRSKEIGDDRHFVCLEIIDHLLMELSLNF